MYTYNEFTPLTVGGGECMYDDGEFKRGSASGKIILILMIVGLAAGAFWLFGTDSGSSLIGGGAESGTGSNAYGTGTDAKSNPYSSREEAVTRAKGAIGATLNSYKSGYKITNPGYIAYAYQWAGLKSSADSTAISTLIRYTDSCSKESLQPGDLLIDDANDFVVMFVGWTNSSKSEYTMLYESPSDKKVVSKTFEYPFLMNTQTGKPWRDVQPRCVKAAYVGATFSSRTEAVDRATESLNAKLNSTSDGFKLTNPGFVAHAYNWTALSTSTDASAIKAMLGYTTSCSKTSLKNGDLLIDNGNNFVVMFNGWTNSSKTEYSMLYMSPGDEKAINKTFPYPFAINPSTNKPWRDVQPRCIKQAYRSADASNSNGGGSSSSSSKNGPCSLTDDSCWNTQIAKQTWSGSLTSNFSLSEFTSKSSKATSSDANKRTTLKFAYELQAVYNYWNDKTLSTWNLSWSGMDNAHGVNITQYDPASKTITIKPSGGRYSFFASMLLDFWKGAIEVKSDNVGVMLTLGSGFQPRKDVIKPRTYTNPSSFGSASNYFTCSMNDYGCWKKAAQSITWTSGDPKITKSFSLSEFTARGLSSSVKTDLTQQMRLVRFASQIQKVKNALCDGTGGCSVNILKLSFTASVPYIKAAATGQAHQDWFAELCRRVFPRVQVRNWSDATIYLPDDAPEFDFRGYGTTFTTSAGLKPKYNWNLKSPVPVSTSYLTCMFGDQYHNSTKATKYHKGIDLGNRSGTSTKITSVYDGEVISSGYDTNGFGNYIKIRHNIVSGNQKIMLTSVYAHLNSRKVYKGNKVDAGDLIGYMGGTSGNPEKPFAVHLHFELCIGSRSSGDACGNVNDMITIPGNIPK